MYSCLHCRTAVHLSPKSRQGRFPTTHQSPRELCKSSGSCKRGKGIRALPFRVPGKDSLTDLPCFRRFAGQRQQRQNYINLFRFLVFLALFLIVLLLQRRSQTAYEVHSHLSSLRCSSNLCGTTCGIKPTTKLVMVQQQSFGTALVIVLHVGTLSN